MRDAAERGNLKAQMALGRLYLTGLEEMGADPGEAEKWLSITSSKGDKEAADLLKDATKARRSKQARHQLENQIFLTYIFQPNLILFFLWF
jgi:TPR repeat protein